jgi:hypothetical protein
MNKQERAERRHQEQERAGSRSPFIHEETQRQAFESGVTRVVRHHKSRCVLKIKAQPGPVKTTWYPNGL